MGPLKHIPITFSQPGKHKWLETSSASDDISPEKECTLFKILLPWFNWGGWHKHIVITQVIRTTAVMRWQTQNPYTLQRATEGTLMRSCAKRSLTRQFISLTSHLSAPFELFSQSCTTARDPTHFTRSATMWHIIQQHQQLHEPGPLQWCNGGDVVTFFEAQGDHTVNTRKRRDHTLP